MKRIEFKSITYPEINIQNFCTCGKKDCSKNVGVAIEIIAEIPKNKLGEFVDILLENQKMMGLDVPVKVILEEIKSYNRG